MFYRFLVYEVWVAMAFGCAACESPLDVDSDIVASRFAIIDGVRSTDAENAVVYISAPTSLTNDSVCTGTLVAPNVVVTALHCVAYYSAGTFSCDVNGTLRGQNPGDGVIGEVAEPAQIEVRGGVFPDERYAPSARVREVVGTGTTQICRGDIALLVLTDELNLPIAPIRLSRTPSIGEPVRIVGYGATENEGSSGRFSRDDLFVLDVGTEATPTTDATAAFGTFVIGEGPCFGDSGGPAFAVESGALLGVFSLLPSASCTALGLRNVYTTVASYDDVIVDGFARAQATLLLEDESASGGGGNAPNSTLSGVDPDAGSGSRRDASCTCWLQGNARSTSGLARFGLGFVGAVYWWRQKSKRQKRPRS